jgi:hypothetical protein
VRELGAKDPIVRESAFAQLRDQGRFAEPVLRRLVRMGPEEVRARAQRLLASEYVSALRAAVNAAGSGAPREEDPLYLRAQLALLLKEVGMNHEARQEGESVLADSRFQSRLDFANDETRHPLRARARAADATGNTEQAISAYTELIRFGAQVQKEQNCRSCHLTSGDGPKNMAWFRDWWAGRRFALAVKHAGLTEQTITSIQGQDNAAARMMLAYLRESQGQKEQALALWQDLERNTRTAQAR